MLKYIITIVIIILPILLYEKHVEHHDYSSPGQTILHHVTNDIDYKIKIPYFEIYITKHIIMLWIVSFILILISIIGTSRYRKNINALPNKTSNVLEILMAFIKDDIVEPNIGKNYAHSWSPLLATFFLFILISNFIGLIPFFEKINGGSSTITGNFSVTVALAFITFISIILAGTKKHGFIGHWKNMVPTNVPLPVLIILIPIEILGMIIKPIVLTLRLGANMTAGHIGMIAIFLLPSLLGQQNGIEMGIFAGILSVLLNIAIYFLEMIVCLVQAYVFTLLSAVFIGMAIHAEH